MLHRTMNLRCFDYLCSCFEASSGYTRGQISWRLVFCCVMSNHIFSISLAIMHASFPLRELHAKVPKSYIWKVKYPLLHLCISCRSTYTRRRNMDRRLLDAMVMFHLKWEYIWKYWYILGHTEVVATKQVVEARGLTLDHILLINYQRDSLGDRMRR